MLDLRYSLIIEATEDPNFSGFSPRTSKGSQESVIRSETPLDKARLGMEEHVELLREQGLPVPPRVARPTVLIQCEVQAT